MRHQKSIFLKTALYACALLFLGILATLFYPYLKSAYLRSLANSEQIFLDTTDSAGIKRHHSGPAWLSTFSVSVVDYDNDGNEGIFVNNHERNRPYFYRNIGDGTFSEVHESIGLLENKIGLVFGSPEFKASASGFYIWLDPDNAINGEWHILWIDHTGAVSPVKAELVTNTKIADVRSINPTPRDQVKVEDNVIKVDASADGSLRGIDFKSTFPESTIQFDLRLNGKSDTHDIFIGPRNVNPTSAPFSLSLGDRHAAIWGDFNNDGNPDLFVPRGAMIGKFKPPHGAKYDELFVNNSNFRFANVIENTGIRNDYGRGRDAQWVDYDNDGLLDLYITNFDGNNLLFKNLGDGTFQDSSKQSGLDFFERAHCLWADFNNDGYPDVFFTNPDGLFLNNGDGTFMDATAKSGLDIAHKYKNMKFAYFWGSGASVADYDNDGDLDLLVTSGKGGGKSKLFEKQNGVFC